MGVLVWVTRPKGWTDQDVAREVINSIAFGRPDGRALYVVPEPVNDRNTA